MARWGRKTTPGLDQPLPWDEGRNVGSRSDAQELPGPGLAAVPDQPAVGEPDSPPWKDDRGARPLAGHPRGQENAVMDGNGASRRAGQLSSERRSRLRKTSVLTPEQRVLRARIAAYRLH